MKLIDYLIIASILGCMFIGNSGHRSIARLLFMLVAIDASWRLWDRRRDKEMARTGGSGELNPELDDVGVSHGHDSDGDD